MNWPTFKSVLIFIRQLLSKSYFMSPTDDAEEAIFKAFDGIDEALKVADEFILSKDEYAAKYYGYGLVSDQIDDHTSQWGGAGPDCPIVRREAAI